MPIIGEEGGEGAQNVTRVVLNGEDSTTFKRRGEGNWRQARMVPDGGDSTRHQREGSSGAVRP